MKVFLIGASRGRNPINPSDRRSRIPTEQRLEKNKEGLCNTLTTVLKDNYVIEIDEEVINETGIDFDRRNKQKKTGFKKDSV